mmetsp:Transcript_8704/g.17666  ORF Transcript_8704/g.17666 Transcript_8704/m.17666 type:complete len:83 (-) Transcript_8704:884-1132(-)
MGEFPRQRSASPNFVIDRGENDELLSSPRPPKSSTRTCTLMSDTIPWRLLFDQPSGPGSPLHSNDGGHGRNSRDPKPALVCR